MIMESVVPEIQVKTEKKSAIPVKVVKTVGKSVKIPAVMVRIAQCESGNRHYRASGEVIKNPVTPDYGKYQLNLPTWGAKAKKLGYNIMTPSGNEAMAMWIYNHEGTDPWFMSRECWA